jgi:hypothetical protein
LRCRSSAQCRSRCMSRRSGRRSTSASTAGSWPGWATTTCRLRSYPGSRRTRWSPGRSSLARQTLTTLLHSDRGTVVPVAAEPSVEMGEERLSIAAIAARSLAQSERQRRAGCALSTSSAQRSTTEAHAGRGDDQRLSRTPCPNRWSGFFRTAVGYPDANDRLRGAVSRWPRGGSNDPSRTQPSRGPIARTLRPASSIPLTNPNGNPKPVLCPRAGPGPASGDRVSRSLSDYLLAGARRPASKQCEVLAHCGVRHQQANHDAALAAAFAQSPPRRSPS